MLDVRTGAGLFAHHASCVGMSADVARKSVSIPFRKTMGMKIKGLPTAASFTFEGACSTVPKDVGFRVSPARY